MMVDAVHYPGPVLLRAHWSLERMPADYLAWRESNAREAIAHHEAGHAVLLLALGIAGLRAKLADDGTTGEVMHGLSRTPPDTGIALPLAIQQTSAIWAAAVFHAGVEAELLAGGFHAPPGTEWRDRTTSDFEKAGDSLGSLFWRAPPHGFAKATARAVLSRNRQAVDAIARRLIHASEWNPSDTPGLSVRLGEEAGAVARACLHYGQPA